MGAALVEPTYTAGLSDPLGDRSICFSARGETSLELLRFRRELADAPGFEAALRSSVEALGRLDPAFATVQAVERLDESGALVLTTVRPGSRRLSEVIARTRGTAYAVDLVLAISPALALLHSIGHAHGALTPERIVLTRDGRPVVVEHVLGAALDALARPPAGFQSLTSVAVPSGDAAVRVDPRLDVVQLGLISLSLVLGRRIAPSDYPGRVVASLDLFAQAEPEVAAAFRPWLERALQIGDRPFADAGEALAAVRTLPAELRAKPAGSPVELPPLPIESAPQVTELETAPASRDWMALARWAAPALAVLVGVAVLGVPSSFRQNAPPASPRSARFEPLAAPVVNTESTPQATTAQADVNSPSTPGAAAPAVFSNPPATPVPPVSVGNLVVESRIELEVFEGDARLGSSTGTMQLSVGSHTVDLVNDEFGFRSQQAVEVTAAGTVTLTVAIPDGRLDVNAVPWADVWIDAAPAGQTPLANLALPIGRHEVVFRHPQLGERRETVIVRADGVARVSVVFQQ